MIMSKSEQAKRIVGWVLHILIAGLMIFAGSGKLFGFAPPEIVQAMTKYGLGDKLKLIGAGEMITALLLLIPLTSSLGILLTSAFWGGVICIHMAHGESYVLQAVFLVLSWLGAYLRNPQTLGSFAGLARFGGQSAAEPQPHFSPSQAGR
jgi:hypothetical protein